MAVPYLQREDAVLVRLAQGEDTRAFDELVRRYQDKVYRLAYKVLRHEHDAAEALQDTFLSAYRGLRNFGEESTFSTWLYRIATNASLMKCRRRRDNHFSLDGSQGLPEEAEPRQLRDWSAQPPERLLTAETREVMREGIQRLNEGARMVFLLRDIEGLWNAEAGAILELSVPAVKSRPHRARLFLRDWMTRYFEDQAVRRPSKPLPSFTPRPARLGMPVSAR
jgi:RNA polymerase sigma-70 factor (ECF subfamily)